MRRFLILLLLLALPLPAVACDPDALGTSRVLPVGTEGGGSVGLKSYPRSLDLEPGEVVLTFDDGPIPGPTGRVLDALKRECVQATFFLIGRNAAAAPALVGRIAREGHTIGTHTMTHAILRRLKPAAALAEVENGIDTVGHVLAASLPGAELAPFFRFPGFANTAGTEAWLAKNNIAVFGADVWASDWTEQGSAAELNLALTRLRRNKGGILLLHDPRAATVAMLPTFLRTLKAEGFRIVHLVPGPGPLKTRPAPGGWTSQTDKILRQLGVSGG